MQQLRVLLCAAALGVAGVALAQPDDGHGPAADGSVSDTAAEADGNTVDQPSASVPEPPQAVRVELNKLQSITGACRAYLVTQNQTDRAFDSFKLDVVMFDNNGIVAKRLAVQIGPMPPGKTSLKVFDIPDLSCQQIGQLLLNNVLECTVDTGKGPPQARDDCLSLVSVSQRGRVPFIE
ncbi:hypothetical protein [Salinisphaera sp.]|uniref:hypothetical protein n=1 Tax=Salinisphaera sp. TaxID=1914330 RepID=UPI002D7A3A9A|nr:hypothetical protein [Salinisphaera sp.]HET7314943.1 hypothetical protein [Salinisphaera sp.]